MRALVVIGLGCLAASAACVPDFAYLDGSGGAGSGDGEAGDRPSRGGGGGDGPGVVAVGVGPGGDPSVGPGPGPGPGPGSTTTSTTGATTGADGAGGGGDGGAPSTTTATTTTGGDATTSTSTGSVLVDDGAPCWNGFLQQVDWCTGNQVCCYDEDYYNYHECDTAGFCSDYAFELQCNDAGDCDEGKTCCVNVDGFGDLTSITCETSCQDLTACSAASPCPDGLTCYYVFDPDSSHDEYDAYGYCYGE